MAHDQSRPLPFLLQPVRFAKSLINGRDIEVMSRHLLFSVPSVFMSRPQFDVAFFAFHFFFFRLRPQFHVATYFFPSNYFPGRDIKVMSRHPFLLLSSSLGRDLNEWFRHHFSC